MTVVQSFDIFDTAITRVYARPTDLFAALAGVELAAAEGNGLTGIDWSRFASHRAEAERRTRQHATSEDITIEAIYGELARMLGITNEQRSELMLREIEVETRSVRPVPSILSAIEQARASGQRIIFMSDMYLPRNVLQSMLEDCGAFQPDDHLYVSGEVGFTKASGNLYRHCLEQEAISANQLHHWGDNEYADVKRARALGIEASRVTVTQINRYEQVIADASEIELSERSLIAGASRLARIQCPYNDVHRRVIWNTSASVAGPVLTGYVAWILQQACRRGQQRLYFLARDGQILAKLARVISARLDLSIECRYLYASRQAWHLPAVSQLGEFEYSWILSPTDQLSIRTLLQRVDLTPHEVLADLLAAGFNFDPDLNLSPAQRSELFAWIQEGHFTTKILSKAEARRGAALAFLRQEGLFDPVNYAIVDIGWNGRLQRSLGNMLTLAGQNRSLDGYYFGLRARMAPRPTDNMYAFLWDGDTSSSRNALGFRTRVLMEIFTASDHGGVVDYSVSGDQVVPRLQDGASKRVKAWGVETQHNAFLEFAAQLDTNTLANLVSPGWCDVSAALLNAFFDQPSVEEAHVYGCYPVAEDQNETTIQQFARPFTWRDVGHVVLGQTSFHHHNEWRRGAECMTEPSVRLALRMTEKAMRIVGFSR